jgi:FkbH-like protein
LTDRFGDYGTVGVAVAQTRPGPWLLKVLLVSCRAMGRGVGEGLLTFMLRRARAAGQPALRALYRQTPHNAAMRLLFAAHSFRPLPPGEPGPVVFERDLSSELPASPVWLEIVAG